MRGSSLVELTGHDNGANLTVIFLIRMSFKEFVWSSYIAEYGPTGQGCQSCLWSAEQGNDLFPVLVRA